MSYYYDNLYQLTRETRSGTVNNYDYRYTYDAAGNRESFEYNISDIVSYYYTGLNQLEETYSSEFGEAQYYSYDYNGNLTKKILDDDTDNQTLYYWDSRNLLTKISKTVSGTTADYTFAYDALGRRKRMTAGGVTTDYVYDGLNVLWQKLSGADTVSYQHGPQAVGGMIRRVASGGDESAAGNRTKQDKDSTVTAFSYNNLNQLTQSETSSTTRTYSYDANGNLTKKYKDANNQTAYNWDSRNLLTKVSVTSGGGSPTDYTFTYDALGRRESMTSGGTTTEYLYEGLKVLVEKTGSLTKRYTNGPQAVGGIISQDDGTDTTYYHYDAIGNVLLTSDGDGYVDETFVQDAYGNVIAGTASGYHLTTKEYFPAFGLYYFNARWYDPEIGRFISRDYFVDKIKNDYIYARSNPIRFIDKDGLKVSDTIVEILGIGGQCCNHALNGPEWVVIGGVWTILPPGRCTNTNQDCDGMTCNGNFHPVPDTTEVFCRPGGSAMRSDKSGFTFCPIWNPTTGPNNPNSPNWRGGGTPPPWGGGNPPINIIPPPGAPIAPSY